MALHGTWNGPASGRFPGSGDSADHSEPKKEPKKEGNRANSEIFPCSDAFYPVGIFSPLIPIKFKGRR
jgi:hypothetical protein